VFSIFSYQPQDGQWKGLKHVVELNIINHRFITLQLCQTVYTHSNLISLFRNFLLGYPPLLVNRRDPRFAKSYYWLCNVCPSDCVRLSVLTHQLRSQWRDFHEIWYLNIFRKSNFFEYMTNFSVSWHEDVCTLMLSNWVLLRLWSV